MADVVGGSVVWNLDVDSSKLNSGLSSAKSSVSKFAQETESQFSNLSKSIDSSMRAAAEGSRIFAGAVLAGGVAFGGIIGMGVKVAGEFERLETALTTVIGDATAAAKAMDTIKQTAKESPFFETATLAQFVQLMAASGQNIDSAVDSAIRFGDVAAAFGKGNAEMSRMGNTLSQVIGKGKADVIDFRELVNAGWVSVRTDTAAALGVTMAQFEEMVSAGEVGYDAISKAAEKFAGSAEKQSANFGALWSRLKETIETTFAELVIDTGIFDQVKNAVGQIITAIESIDPSTIASIFSTIIDNAPIIIGIIAGGLTPAIYALASSFVAAMVPLLPFIAAGAALGVVAKLVIDSLGGWEEAQKKVQQGLEVLSNAYNTYLKPALDSLWNAITQELMPALKSLWELLGPVLEPVLRFLAGAIGSFLVGALRIAIDVIRLVIQWVATMIQNFVDMVNFFRSIPGRIAEALSGVKNAITKPFTDAWNSVKGVAENIKNTLDLVNPFHRNSPSLVDNVRSGVAEIIDEYSSLKSIKLPQVSGLAPALDYQPAFATATSAPAYEAPTSSSAGNQYITFENVNVRDEGDIDALTRELGFMSSITPGVME